MRGTRDVTKHSGVQGRLLRAARLGVHSCTPSTRMREEKKIKVVLARGWASLLVSKKNHPEPHIPLE